LKIATWNINGVVRRLPLLLAWLASARPDVVALQETKATDAEFPHAALQAAGYGSITVGQRPWNGVALLARAAEPIVVRRALPGDAGDTQARYLEAAIGGVLFAAIYLPNGNPQPGPKFAYKLAWFERLIAHAASLQASGHPVALAGDFNVVPTERDIYPTTSYRDNALLQPEPRDAFRRLLAQGWTDAIRSRHPDETIYTFWDYLRQRWPRNAGLRIDHLLLSAGLAARLRDAGVDRDERGREGASDHAPVWAELAAARAGRRKS
jgi:exodeoxyribonuclease III